MHTVASSTSLEDSEEYSIQLFYHTVLYIFLLPVVSPLSSRASLYHRGRCTNVYDYGFGNIDCDQTLLVCPQASYICCMFSIMQSTHMVAGQVQEALVLCRRCCSLRLTRQACTPCVRW